MKKLSIIALFLAFAMVLTGCYSTELKLYDAITKTEDVGSAETDTVFTISIDGEEFAMKDDPNFQMVISALDGAKFEINQRMVQNETRDAVKAVADMGFGFDLMGMTTNMDASVWVDVDLSGEDMKLLEIIKLPPFIMNFIPLEGDTEKEYIVYDFNELLQQEGMEIDTKNLLGFAKDFQDKLENGLVNYKKNFNPGFSTVKYKGKRLFDGEQQDVYEVSINDKTFKDLLKYTVNYTLEDEEALDLIKDYFAFIIDMAAAKDEKAEIEAVFGDLESKLPIAKEMFNSFMEKYKDVKVLGDEGILITYYLDKDGYVISQASNIQLMVDLEGIGKVLEKEELTALGNLKINMNAVSKIKNINGDVELNWPEITEDNSINVIDLINSIESDFEPAVQVEPIADIEL